MVALPLVPLTRPSVLTIRSAPHPPSPSKDSVKKNRRLKTKQKFFLTIDLILCPSPLNVVLHSPPSPPFFIFACKPLRGSITPRSVSACVPEAFCTINFTFFFFLAVKKAGVERGVRIRRAVVNRLRSLTVRNTHVPPFCMMKSSTEMRFWHVSPFFPFNML